MIDIELIRSDPRALSEALQARSDEPIDLGSILDVDRLRRSLAAKVDEMRARRNEVSKAIGSMRREGSDTTELESEAVSLREQIADATAEREAEEARLHELLMALPNVPDERVPRGGKESNEVVRVWGEQRRLEHVRDHVELSTRLALVDYERGAKLGGNGFWIYTGMGAALEWAILDLFCRDHVQDGYEFLLPPHLLLEECGYAAGQFPKFYDDVYHLAPEPNERGRFLLPTAETAILAMYREEILDEDALPLKSFAYTPCYRRESGSYRTEERGTIRGHQFNKVEIFQVTAPEDSEQALHELVRKAEQLVEQLGLHYRTSLLATRDLSASMAITYDVEVWIPSIRSYKEVSSASSARDYQARRANIRLRRGGRKQLEYVHTLNASALATSRLVPALLEQCQQPDGSVLVPAPLTSWLGTDVLRPPSRQ